MVIRIPVENRLFFLLCNFPYLQQDISKDKLKARNISEQKCISYQINVVIIN